MTLRSDAKGFLIADTATDIGGLTEGIEGIRKDTSAILALLKEGNRQPILQRAKVSNQKAYTRMAAPARGRLARDPATGRFVVASPAPAAANTAETIPAAALASPAPTVPSAPVPLNLPAGRPQAPVSKQGDSLEVLAAALNSMTRTQAAQAAEQKRSQMARESRGGDKTVDKDRDHRGRFIGGGGNNDHGLLFKLKDGIQSAFSSGAGATSDMNKVDPVIEATNEVAGLASGPLKLVAAAAKPLIGRNAAGKEDSKNDKSVPWFRRVFGELRIMRKENKDFSKAEVKAMEGIKVDDGGGLWDMIKSVISLIFDPVGVAIIGAVVGLWATMGDKISAAWSEVTSKISSLWSDLTGTMSKAWNGAVKWFLDLWNPIADWFKDKLGIATEVVSAVKGKAASAVDAVKEKAVEVFSPIKEKVDAYIAPMKEKSAAVVEPVQEAAKNGVSAVRSGADYVGETLIDPVKEGAAIVVDKAKSAFGKGSAGNKAVLKQGMLNAGITDPKEQAMFMAQMEHESGGFRSLRENISYRPKQFLKMFGKRAGIRTEEEARAILDKGPQATAEAMYGGDWGKKNLGNVAPGDALKFKGRGFAQLTGRANYEAAAKGTGLDLVNNPEQAADPVNAAKIATWYWKSRTGLSEAGKSGDIVAATKKINGGRIGLEDRKRKYDKYLAETIKRIDTGGPVVASTKAAKRAPGDALGGTSPAPAAVPVVAMAKTSPETIVETAASPTPAIPSVVAAASPPPRAATVAVLSVKIPSPPTLPPTAQAVIPEPLNSKAPLKVTVADSQLASQDIRDRRLAAIATGGLSS